MKKLVELNTPVLFLVFNRLEQTKKVFAEIKKAEPKKLFIACDGPRAGKIGEEKTVEEIRRYILKNVNWKCEVKTLFRDRNFGCKKAVSSAITWFFENIEQGIILEDDCLPSQSFFYFCQEMLNKYKNDEKIFHVSGTNVEGVSKIKSDYFLSNSFNVWGWATWRRCWKNYDVDMKEWRKIRFSGNFLSMVRELPILVKLNSWRLYNKTYQNKIDTWDYQWDYLCKKENSFSIIPRKNLITNLGFDVGTHTTNYKKDKKTLKRFDLTFSAKFKPSIKKDYAQNYSEFFKN